MKTGGQNWSAKPIQTTITPTQPAPMSTPWGQPAMNPMGAPVNPAGMNGNWMNSNPFGATVQPANPMNPMQPNMMQQQQRPAVASTNNPFDLF